MHVIGPYKHRSEIELDPVQAYRRGRALDGMLRSAAVAPARGVHRGTFKSFERMDEERMIEAARRVNK